MKMLLRPVAALCAASAVKVFTVWVLLASFSSGEWRTAARRGQSAATPTMMPHSNQESLLGIFLTGPFSWLLGAVGGALYSLARRKHELEMQLIAKLLNGDIDRTQIKHLECHPSLRGQKSASSC